MNFGLKVRGKVRRKVRGESPGESPGEVRGESPDPDNSRNGSGLSRMRSEAKNKDVEQNKANKQKETKNEITKKLQSKTDLGLYH